MNSDVIYSYKKSRKQQSLIFINMGTACFLYIIALYAYEQFSQNQIDQSFKSIFLVALIVSAFILFYVAWWLRTHPGVYEATITKDRFIIKYPESEAWSFDIRIEDIIRFEHRNTISHAGKGIAKSGVLLHDGTFYEVCMNYGLKINEAYKVIKTIKPDITFPNKVNLKAKAFGENDK